MSIGNIGKDTTTKALKRQRAFALCLLYQLRMPFNGLFYPLWLNADVPLCGGCGAVLKQPLDKGNVITVILVDFRCVPFAEAVSADAVKAEIITDDGKLFLYCPLCNGKNQLIWSDAVAQTVILDVLLNDEGNGEDASLAGLLLCDLKAVSVAIPHNA